MADKKSVTPVAPVTQEEFRNAWKARKGRMKGANKAYSRHIVRVNAKLEKRKQFLIKEDK